MKTLEELRARREEVVNLLQPFEDLEPENFSEDQYTEFTNLTEEIESLDADIEKQEKVQAIVNRRDRLTTALNRQTTPSNVPAPRRIEDTQIVIPTNAQPRRELKAFKNPEDAYVSGRWMLASFFDHQPSVRWLADHGVLNASFQTGDDQYGGAFVPVQLENTIIRLVESYGVFRQNSMYVPMASARYVKQVRTGGVTAYAMGETTGANEGSNTTTRTEPSYKPVELIARKWGTEMRMSNEFAEDSIVEMADQFAVESALAFANAEDDAAFNGDGTSTYNGIVGLKNALAAGSILETAGGSLAFGDITLVEFGNAVGKLPDYQGINPKWYISKPGYYASMDKLKNAAGGNTKEELSTGASASFLGYDVVWTRVLPTALTDQASTILAYFGDLSMGTLYGERKGMTMDLTDQRYWDEDQIAVKARKRMDVNIHSRGDASNPGAVIAIKTPAS